jgi:hypothetical protein
VCACFTNPHGIDFWSLALQVASEGLQVLNTLSADLNFLPVWIVDFFDEILSLFIECGSTELAEKALRQYFFSFDSPIKRSSNYFSSFSTLFILHSVFIIHCAVEYLTFLPWYHHIKLVLERVCKKYSDPALQIPFIRNIKLAINELDQHFSQQMYD